MVDFLDSGVGGEQIALPCVLGLWIQWWYYKTLSSFSFTRYLLFFLCLFHTLSHPFFLYVLIYLRILHY